MKTDTPLRFRHDSSWLKTVDCDIEDFARQQRRETDPADYPWATEIVRHVPVYDGAQIRSAALVPEQRQALLAEWSNVMMHGPGLVVLRGAITDLAVVDAATARFDQIIAAQRASGATAADHFAKPGANDRVWNALEKLCLLDPETFAAYYANASIALISEAWLGPAYQVTSQVNVVNPGGAAQSPHRDYHLGFQSGAEMERYPAHVHRLSPFLTLQGAVAHCDMPIESGPTLYLPYSQTYEPGYLATGRTDFREYFDRHHIQLPLRKGDAIFFNPALFHAAGHNRSVDIRRMANLLQVSSAFGRAMERIDRTRMSRTLYPVLLSMRAARRIDDAGLAHVVAASSEGYPFPADLDRDPPAGGLAPASQQALVHRALAENWEPSRLETSLEWGNR